MVLRDITEAASLKQISKKLFLCLEKPIKYISQLVILGGTVARNDTIYIGLLLPATLL